MSRHWYLVPDEWQQEKRAGLLVCHYCFAVATTWDHIVPRCRGGSGYPRNLVPACEPCNTVKGGRLPTCRCRHCRRALQWWWRRLLVAGSSGPEIPQIPVVAIDGQVAA